jgi:hypothetical protein
VGLPARVGLCGDTWRGRSGRCSACGTTRRQLSDETTALPCGQLVRISPGSPRSTSRIYVRGAVLREYLRHYRLWEGLLAPLDTKERLQAWIVLSDEYEDDEYDDRDLDCSDVSFNVYRSLENCVDDQEF